MKSGVRAIVVLALLAVLAAPVLAMTHCPETLAGEGAAGVSAAEHADCASHASAVNAIVSSGDDLSKPIAASAVAASPVIESAVLPSVATGASPPEPPSSPRVLHCSPAFTCLFLI